MKKILLLFFSLFSFNAISQTSVYHPFPDSNVVWIQRDWWTDFGPVTTCVVFNDYDLFISGDTTIGSYTYHKLYANGHTYATCPPPGWYYSGTYWGAFRQDTLNKKVYLYTNGADTLAYDFNLNAGDTLPATCLEFSAFNYVQSVDSVLIGAQYHKRFWLTSFGFPVLSNYAVMIEGIGTSLGAFAPLYPPFESGNDLFCVKINNQTVWVNPIYNQCFLFSVNENEKSENKISINPNPMNSTSVLSVDAEFINAELEIYNAFGEVVKQYLIYDFNSTIYRDNLPNGIYFYRLTNNKGHTASGKFIID